MSRAGPGVTMTDRSPTEAEQCSRWERVHPWEHSPAASQARAPCKQCLVPATEAPISFGSPASEPAAGSDTGAPIDCLEQMLQAGKLSKGQGALAPSKCLAFASGSLTGLGWRPPPLAFQNCQ